MAIRRIRSETFRDFRGWALSLLAGLGGWLAYGERKYGETYAQALDATDYEYDTLKAAKWVSKRIKTVRRRTVLILL